MPNLAEIVSTFKGLSSCGSCGRSPYGGSIQVSTSHAPTSTNDNNTITANDYYHGQLLTTSCGHLFCQDCWDKSIDCPICQGSTSLEPRPAILSTTSYSTTIGAPNKHSNIAEDGAKSKDQTCNLPLQFTNNLCDAESIEQMGALLGMLRQMRGVELDGSTKGSACTNKKVTICDDIPTKKGVDDELLEDDDSEEEFCRIMKPSTNKTNKEDDVESSDSDDDEETELPPEKSIPQKQRRIRKSTIPVRVVKNKHYMNDEDSSSDEDSKEDETELPIAKKLPQKQRSTTGRKKKAKLCLATQFRRQNTNPDDNDNDDDREDYEKTQMWEKDPNILSMAQHTHPDGDDDDGDDDDDREEYEKTQMWERDPTILSMATSCERQMDANEKEKKDPNKPALAQQYTTPSIQAKQREPYEQTQGWEKEISSDPAMDNSYHWLWAHRNRKASGSVSSANQKQAGTSQQMAAATNDKELVVEETPTVRESQVSSIRLSSIKGSGQPKVENEETLVEETEVAGTNMEGYRNNYGLYSNSPDQLEDGQKDREEEEEEVSHTSPLRAYKLYNSQSQSQQVEKTTAQDDKGDGTGEQKSDNLVGPRRVSTSPAKERRNVEAQPKPGTTPSPSPLKKRPRVDTPNDDEQQPHIRPWNVQSEPFMSPLTCEVRTCPTGMRFNDPTQRPQCAAFNNELQSPDNQTSPLPDNSIRNRTQTLHVSYDVIDDIEANALKSLHEQGSCRLVLDGIQSVTKDNSLVPIPFPAVLVTHAIDMPSIDGQETKMIPTCYRTYSYLKAKSLGALIIDARWAIDSQVAGFMLDYKSYEISYDVESYKLVASMNVSGDASSPNRESNIMLAHKFDGITFGMIRGLDCSASLEAEETKSQTSKSSLRVTPKPITTDEIEYLIKSWGGTVVVDVLTHMDLLLVDDVMTLDQIVEGLKLNFASNSDVNRWSIEKSSKDVLDNFLVDGCLSRDYGEGLEVKIPIIRAKWLEDSICLGHLQSLESYCWGILIL